MKSLEHDHYSRKILQPLKFRELRVTGFGNRGYPNWQFRARIFLKKFNYGYEKAGAPPGNNRKYPITVASRTWCGSKAVAPKFAHKRDFAIFQSQNTHEHYAFHEILCDRNPIARSRTFIVISTKCYVNLWIAESTKFERTTDCDANRL